MIDALRYEWVRLTSIRSTYWLVGAALFLHLLIGALIAWAATYGDEEITARWDSAMFGMIATAGASFGLTPMVGAYLLGMIGVLAMGHEYRYGTIRSTLTALPNRVTVLAAKATVTAVLAALVGAICIAMGVLVTALFGLNQADGEAFAQIGLGTVVYFALFTLWGLALGALVRNQTIAVALLLAVPSIVELLVRVGIGIAKAVMGTTEEADWLAAIAKYLPFDAGGQMFEYLIFADDDPSADQLPGLEPLSAVGGGVVMAVFVALLSAAAVFRFVRRDA